MVITPEAKQLIQLITQKTPLTAMLAPSFVIDFDFPQIVGKLKRLGFQYVLEVAVGAIDTNRQALQELKNHPQKRLITSPCPSIYQMIKTQYSQLLPFLSQADSPMVATARIIQQKFPETKPVFIGPCVVKKLEAARYPELKILSVTFKDIMIVLNHFQIKDNPADVKAEFDLGTCNTRIYPISGGLAESANLESVLKKEEYRVVSGPAEVKEALDEFLQNPQIRFLDILFCQAGCINGLGVINNKISLKERKDKVMAFWNQCIRGQNDLEEV